MYAEELNSTTSSVTLQRTDRHEILGQKPTQGIHLKRDSLSSITYSEKLNSGKSSATLQSTDRHYGIVGQKRSHFQRYS
jgi:hypothetical protein